MIDKKQLTIENKEMLPLFPTCVWKFQLKPEDAERVNNNIKKKLNELTAGRPRLSPGTKWQTEQQLNHLKEF